MPGNLVYALQPDLANSAPPEQTPHQNLQTFHSCYSSAHGLPWSLNSEQQTNTKGKFISYSFIPDGFPRHLVVAQMVSVCSLWCFLCCCSVCWTRFLAERVLFFTGSSWRASELHNKVKMLLFLLIPLSYFQSWGHLSCRWQLHSTSPIPHRPDLAMNLLQSTHQAVQRLIPKTPERQKCDHD